MLTPHKHESMMGRGPHKRHSISISGGLGRSSGMSGSGGMSGGGVLGGGPSSRKHEGASGMSVNDDGHLSPTRSVSARLVSKNNNNL